MGLRWKISNFLLNYDKFYKFKLEYNIIEYYPKHFQYLFSQKNVKSYFLRHEYERMDS